MSTGRGSTGTKPAGTRNYVNTKLLCKDLQKLGKTVNKAAENAVKVAIQQSTPFAMSFDSVEALPWVTGTDGRLVIAGPALEKSTEGSLESILAAQTQFAADVLSTTLHKRLKEALE